MDTNGSDNASDVIITVKCCVCLENKITKEAEKYCVECQDYYCLPCADTHKKFPLMRGHKLLDKADFSSVNLQSALPCFPTERCRIHKAKLLDFYCKNHDEVICATCFAVNHRSCQDIHSIPDEVDSLYKESASTETMAKLSTAKKVAEDIMNNKQHLLYKLKENRTKATDAIKDFRKEMEIELKKLETESLKEMDAEYEKQENDLQNEIKEVEQYTADLEQKANKLVESDGNKAQEFVRVKNAENDIKAMETKSFEKEETCHVEIDFFANSRIKDFLKNLTTLGEIAVYKPRATVYTVKNQKDINTKLEDDKGTCRNWGSCFIGDGTVLLSDGNNKKLKRVDISTNSVKDHLNLEVRPIAVCQTNEREAAVSLNNKTIQFVSLGDRLTIAKMLKMDHDCCGLAYNDGKLFISDGSGVVYIHDVSGTVLNKITTDKSGNSIFSQSRHICVGTNRDTVYVADGDKGLITLDMEGNHLSTLTDPAIAAAQGVCTDGRGNVLVCGWKSSNIAQISEKSRTKLDVLGTVEHPLSVCFDQNQNTLYVTCENTNTLKVYNLQ